jgi:phenylacetate-CoA ligase
MEKEAFRNSPSFVKKLLRSVRSNLVPFPYCYGLQFSRFYHSAKTTQWLPTEKLEEIKNKRLKTLVMHAFQNVPYYKRIFEERRLKPEDIQSREDLTALPVLTKSDVRKHFAELVASGFRSRGHLYESGGTTGKPLRFYKDFLGDVFQSALVWRYREWAGYDPKARWAVMRYETFVHSGHEVPYRIENNTLYLSSFHLRRENIQSYLSIVEKFGTEAIWAFPSTLYMMARHLRASTERPNLDLKAIFTSSETLFRNHRQLIEEQFKCKIYDWYGSNEGVVSAAECPQGNYHITEEGIIEILDRDGNPCSFGEEGKVVGTCLWNYVMPFIRYELGDIASLSKERCECGRGLPLLQGIEGRIDDAIVTKDGRLVGRLDEAFHFSFGIKESQIIQDKLGSMTVKIVKDTCFSDKDIRLLDKELKKRLGDSMDIRYEIVEEIPRTNRGKYQFVISKIIKDFVNSSY